MLTLQNSIQIKESKIAILILCKMEDESTRKVAIKPSEDEIRTLILRSQDMKEKAYAAYSHFKVGAALLTDNGAVFTGRYVIRKTGGRNYNYKSGPTDIAFSWLLRFQCAPLYA